MSAAAEVLSPREREVVERIARGLKYDEIAEELEIGYEAVKTYAARVRKKLKLNSKVQIALWAVEHNLVENNGRTNSGPHSG